MSHKKKIILNSLSASTKNMEQDYLKQLNMLGKELLKAVREQILPILQNNKQELKITQDGLPDQLAISFALLNRNFTGVISASLANKAINSIANKNAERFNRAIPQKLEGINIANVISNEKLDDFVKTSIAQNSQLIKSIPEQFLSQVQSIVYNGYITGERYDDIAKKILGKTGSAGSKLSHRLKTIARTETNKINSQLTMLRSTALGIKKGIYQTSKDERVRESHKELNGVEYEITKGAWSKIAQKYIIPGVTDINCRCSYKPVLELD